MTVPLLSLVLIFGCHDSTKTRAKFATYQQMKDAGYLANDWIPPCFPENATDILDQHDLETNAAWVTFRLEGQPLADFQAALKKPPKDTFYRATGWGTPAWWPKEPAGPLFVLKCPWVKKNKERYITYVVVDEAQRQVYLWR